VADALAVRHQVLRASRKAEDPALRIDIGIPASIRAFFERLEPVDGVISCAGDARYGAIGKLSDDDIAWSLSNKLLGQVNLVRFGIDKVKDKGVFLLTAGIYSQKPPPGVPAFAMANGALESFARAASLDLPRGIRLNTVSPPWLEESAARMGKPGAGTLSAAENAKAYVALAEGTATGQVVYPAGK
jgi:NAD(P)-dependent dehydrogenase (short-subunit alcohol dehydrogenase family)